MIDPRSLERINVDKAAVDAVCVGIFSCPLQRLACDFPSVWSVVFNVDSDLPTRPMSAKITLICSHECFS